MTDIKNASERADSKGGYFRRVKALKVGLIDGRWSGRIKPDWRAYGLFVTF
ncbi:hypothetical protein [Pseudomonas maioricensis]|uniref:hypothetical protein n=1 Tax=Pseudomonas maioricensis TaxID=1766623 RepID=UPI001FAC658E|nr:hypothetical protein [Pseudomonas sp. S25]